MCAERCWGDDVFDVAELLGMDLDEAEALALKLRRAGWKSPALQSREIHFTINQPEGFDEETIARLAAHNLADRR